MLVNFKKLDNSRSSALYCKYKLLNNLLINIEYIPAVKTDITTPYGSTCRYDSYKHVSSQEVEVVIVGKNKQYQNISPQNESNNELINNPISRSITLRYTYNITGDFYDYVRKVEGAQISMD
ncbi:MAG: hypothetical protein K9M11_00535 [Candidatus Pacebacteria bacterium]|nr:hypothetical protein [Candidatus Paceibacterota bacterium]